jgi:hypothetical protein
MPPDLYASDAELASFFARPGWERVKATLQLWGHYEVAAEIDEVIERVRREVWRDLSASQVRES